MRVIINVRGEEIKRELDGFIERKAKQVFPNKEFQIVEKLDFDLDIDPERIYEIVLEVE